MMSIWNFSKNISVRGLILSPDGKQLCLIRREKRGQLYYVAPGGGLGKNEDHVIGLHREVLEETGLEICGAEKRGVIEFEGKLQVYYSARALGTRISPSGEESSLVWQKDHGLFHPEWISFHDLEQLPFVSPVVLKALIDYPIKGWPRVEFKELEKQRSTKTLKAS